MTITTSWDFADYDGMDSVNYVKVVKNYNGTDIKKCGKFIDAVVGNPIPLPGGLYLLGSGLLGLAGIRKKMKA